MRRPGPWALALPLAVLAPLGTAATAGAIVDGTAATAAGSTVALQIETGTKVSFCTGTLVRANVVLTAAHCIDGDPKRVRVLAGVLDRSVSPPPAAGDFIATRMQDSRDFEKGSKTTKPSDIAYLELGRGSTQPTVGVAFARPKAGTTQRIRGFGRTSENADGTPDPTAGNGVLHEAKIGITTCPKGTDADVFCSEYGALKLNAATCRGDSGGPVLQPSTNKLIGITSGGSAGCKGRTRFNDVSAHQEFVAEALSERLTGRVFDSTKVAAAVAAGARPDDARIAAAIPGAVVKARYQDGTLASSTPAPGGRFTLPLDSGGPFDVELIAKGYTTVLANDLVVKGPVAFDGGMVPGVSTTPKPPTPAQVATVTSAERRTSDELTLEVAVNPPPGTHAVSVRITALGVGGVADYSGGGMKYAVKRPISTKVPFLLKGQGLKRFAIGKRFRATILLDGKVVREQTLEVAKPAKSTSG
ncbi:S1 family peptidase [Patulibacter minatonensis]|uniref:S1 family peptidase n=1 Tax=Patulibacter minatonensis TaxID=298163 RepID=UPI000479C21B|nr:trypsin-like serine protease [Patulibacter minatonensis]